MYALRKRQQGVSTLIMILAIGAALAASLYGAYSHMQANGKFADTSTARTQARALARDSLDASAAYLNQLYCGTTNGTCMSGNVSAVAVGALPVGTVLLNQTVNGNTMMATVIGNTFGSNGEIEVSAVGQTPTSADQIRAYLTAATIYTFTPLQYAFLINGNQNITGDVAINTGTSSLTVLGNLGISGNASVTGTAQATGSITGCSTTATCTSDISASGILSPNINVYNLSTEANAVFSVNATGEPEVTFENDSALTPAGTTLLSAFPSSSTSLCVSGGASCITGPSNHDGIWAVNGTPTPGVLYFYGDVSVASGAIGTSSSGTVGYATILATGNVSIATQNDIVSYGQMPNVCNQTTVPTNVCPSGSTTVNDGEGSGPVANAVLISGGSVNYPYVGGSTVYAGGTASTGVPAMNASTESDASSITEPSGTVTGYYCSSNANSVGTTGACSSTSTTSGVITGGNVTLSGNGDLTGVVAAGESLTAKGTGIITGMIDTADSNNLSSSTLGNNTSLNDIQGNLNINYAPGVSNMTNFGGGGQVPARAFIPLWQRFIY